uniref:Uncharacterized protein n=1 Tax=Picea glauca TaxID=3330 RepID=A0A101M054_PICGL|nr:hypothetical protein ABT39_MTgene4631 [Picea glauca]QHR92485.1 hypothetical protein Q903MT_gene6531 [Picea sitchensis]
MPSAYSIRTRCVIWQKPLPPTSVESLRVLKLDTKWTTKHACMAFPTLFLFVMARTSLSMAPPVKIRPRTR